MALRRRARGRGRFHRRPAPPRQTSSREPPAPAEAPDQAGLHIVAPTPRRKTILVLEDYATIGGIIPALLREEGYRALRAWSIGEALKIARDRRPDLILLDLGLPYREGLAMLDELQANPDTKDAPIIVIASGALQLAPEVRERLAACLAKPIDIDRFLNHVRRALGEPEQELPEKKYDTIHDAHLHSW